MNKIDLKKTTYRLIDTVLEAGKLAKKIAHRGVKVTIKSDNTPVTDGDLAVDQVRGYEGPKKHAVRSEKGPHEHFLGRYARAGVGLVMFVCVRGNCFAHGLRSGKEI